MDQYFDLKTKALPAGLTAGEIAFFKKYGYVGPFPLLSHEGVEKATSLHYTSQKLFKPRSKFINTFIKKPWNKSMHVLIPEYREIAKRPFMVEKIAALLGQDLIAWGAITTQRTPGQKHRWHVDLEHRHWKGVSAFLGLKGTSKLTSLSVITESQNLVTTPQSLNMDNNDSVLAYCRETIPDAELVTVDVNEGEFFLFDGLVWHASENKSDEQRIAMIIQYSTPEYKIKRPRTWEEPLKWHISRPSVVLVKGADNFGVNKLR
jgi:ectoine hydroxylase-related dioxygenase (phytanoyl-CoA dioxygenase family)